MPEVEVDAERVAENQLVMCLVSRNSDASPGNAIALHLMPS